jgi:hypothetical protein
MSCSFTKAPARGGAIIFETLPMHIMPSKSHEDQLFLATWSTDWYYF